MSIECYYASCKNHADQYGTAEEPLCENDACTATEDELTKFQAEREVHLKLLNMNLPKEERKYPVPEDIQTVLEEARAYTQLRGVYASLPFGFNKAVKCAKKSVQLHRKGWFLVMQLHPELLNEDVSYNNETCEMEIKK